MTQLTNTLISRMGTTFDVVALMNELFPAAINHLLDLEIIGGTGTGEMLGVVTDTNVPTVFRAALNEVSHADYIETETKIPADYRSEMVYVIADAGWQAYKKKLDSNGRPLYLGVNQSPADGAAKVGSTYNEHPVIPTQRLTLGSAGDLIAGVFSEYGVAIEQDFVFMANPYEAMNKNAVNYYAWMQVGGKPHQPRMFAKLAATIS